MGEAAEKPGLSFPAARNLSKGSCSGLALHSGCPDSITLLPARKPCLLAAAQNASLRIKGGSPRQVDESPRQRAPRSRAAFVGGSSGRRNPRPSIFIRALASSDVAPFHRGCISRRLFSRDCQTAESKCESCASQIRPGSLERRCSSKQSAHERFSDNQ